MLFDIKCLTLDFLRRQLTKGSEWPQLWPVCGAVAPPLPVPGVRVLTGRHRGYSEKNAVDSLGRSKGALGPLELSDFCRSWLKIKPGAMKWEGQGRTLVMFHIGLVGVTIE